MLWSVAAVITVACLTAGGQRTWTPTEAPYNFTARTGNTEPIENLLMMEQLNAAGAAYYALHHAPPTSVKQLETEGLILFYPLKHGVSQPLIDSTVRAGVDSPAMHVDLNLSPKYFALSAAAPYTERKVWLVSAGKQFWQDAAASVPVAGASDPTAAARAWVWVWVESAVLQRYVGLKGELPPTVAAAEQTLGFAPPVPFARLDVAANAQPTSLGELRTSFNRSATEILLTTPGAARLLHFAIDRGMGIATLQAHPDGQPVDKADFVPTEAYRLP